jgi:hypothetical protein
MCLVNDDLYEIAVETFTDVLSNYSRFLSKEDFILFYSLFNSQWSQQRYGRLISGDFDFDSVQFGLLMIAFGDATVVDLAQKASTIPQYQQFLTALCGLLGAEGFAVNEDKIFVPALEFWNTLVETMIDFTYSEDGPQSPPWFPEAQRHIMQAIRVCWRKIQFPPPDEFNSWDSVDRTGFKDARRDVSDLLQQFYLIEGIPIMNTFIELSQQSIKTGNWTELEASLYCLSSFPDCITADEDRDHYLRRVFEPSLFVLFTDSQMEVPIRALQAFLGLLDGYADYFMRETDNLPRALNVAFGATGFQALAKRASYTIIELCSNCRNILVPELGTFLQQFGSMAHSSIEGSIKEGVMQGIASIIEAVGSETSQIGPLSQLIHFIEADTEQCFRYLSLASASAPAQADSPSKDYVVALEYGLTALRCLEGIAKGLQAPTDQPVDLEKNILRSPFWITGQGSIVQHRIMSILDRVYNAFCSRGEVIEACSHVFRRGFGEREPGPFVFPARTVAHFLVRANSQTPRLGLVISTACSFMSSHKAGDRIDEDVDMLVKWLTQLLQNLSGKSHMSLSRSVPFPFLGNELGILFRLSLESTNNIRT